MKDFLTAQEIEILEEAHHSSRFRKSADRIKTILFLNNGFTYAQTAKLLLLDETTIRRYEKEYQESGIDGLLEHHYHGSFANLSKAQEKELTGYLKTNLHQTAKEAAAYIQQTYAISYSVEGVTHLLHRLGFVYKKTKIVPGKLDARRQVIFQKMYQLLKEEIKQPEDRMYFLDGTHPVHNNKPCYGWIYKGEIKTSKGNSGRKRLNLNGALNLEDMEITVLAEKTIDTNAMIHLFTELERKQPEGSILCFADNASYNHSRELKKFLRKHKRIELFYLPPYSPNLNPIERLWLFFHKKILYDKYYETFKEFKTATLDFFQNIKQYDAELKTLLTDSFQTLSV
jgi:transposase